MDNNKTKRVEIRIPTELHKQLTKIKDRCRFKSENELVKHLVQLYVGLAIGDKESHQNIEEEIDQEFEELSYTQDHKLIKHVGWHHKSVNSL